MVPIHLHFLCLNEDLAPFFGNGVYKFEGMNVRFFAKEWKL